jgi:hypothetical protein
MSEPTHLPSWPFDDDDEAPREVPREFHSEYHSAPFPKCIDCECELLDSGEVYAVIKSIVAGETVFEMAICGACSTRLAESYSEHSRCAFERQIRGWNDVPPSDDAPGNEVSAEEPLDVDDNDEPPKLERGSTDSLSHCAGCGRPRTGCHRYAIVGAFVGRAMVSAPAISLQLPLMICDRCNSQATEDISQQTRDSWDQFVEDHFDGPPGIDLHMPRLDPVLI